MHDVQSNAKLRTQLNDALNKLAVYEAVEMVERSHASRTESASALPTNVARAATASGAMDNATEPHGASFGQASYGSAASMSTLSHSRGTPSTDNSFSKMKDLKRYVQGCDGRYYVTDSA